ncbi:MAG: glycosyltransferase family 4 protein [Deltaproteobacteria bacterium]|nr:glycosyltransferase family 4 protein [Deltaproteobacteria bacterium]
MRKLVFISNMAAPYQVKFCHAMQAYFDAEFWYHVRLEPDRPGWWRVPLGPRNRILDHVLLSRSRRYLSLDIVRELDRFDPDVVMLGGLVLLSNVVAYAWAKARGKHVVAFTELRRSPAGEPRGRDAVAALLRAYYGDLDCIMTSAEEGARQYRDDYGFPRVVSAHYPADIDGYFRHADRPRDRPCTILFPNRLIDLYDPLLALEVFARVRAGHPELRMLMNAAGPLRAACEERIATFGQPSPVSFLDGIARWDDLPLAYDRADILLLPARFSVGNFTIVEGMASGMGMVVSDRIQGFGQLIREGHNGFSRPPEVEAMADGIERYLAEPTLYSAHAAINRELVRPYTLAETARLFRDVVESVVGPDWLRRNGGTGASSP